MIVKDVAICNPKNKYTIPNNYINYIDTASVTSGILENVQYLTKDYPSRAQRIVEQDDILISSVRPNLKHNYYAKFALNNMVASSGFIQIRNVKQAKIDTTFLYYFLTSPINIRHYCGIAENSQSAFPSFNKSVIENLELPHISLIQQKHISNISELLHS